MNFFELAEKRQSCRNYDATRAVPEDNLSQILSVARLAPSACNGQPYHITVCTGEKAKAVAKETQGIGINGFAADAPVLLVISEEAYVKTAAFGAKVTGNDYRSIDIGILASYIVSAATELGLGTCILGWFNGKKVGEICGVDGNVRLVITLGYAKEGEKLRPKKRKPLEELVDSVE